MISKNYVPMILSLIHIFFVSLKNYALIHIFPFKVVSIVYNTIIPLFLSSVQKISVIKFFFLYSIEPLSNFCFTSSTVTKHGPFVVLIEKKKNHVGMLPYDSSRWYNIFSELLEQAMTSILAHYLWSVSKNYRSINLGIFYECHMPRLTQMA